MKTPTKKQVETFIKNKLSSDKKWAIKCLEIVYNNQTEQEKGCDEVFQVHELYPEDVFFGLQDLWDSDPKTIEKNGVGFTKTDAEIMSSIYSQYLKTGRISDRQMQVVLKRIPKYWKQFLAKADKEKLYSQVLSNHK
jgi:hypothetical protein